MLRESIVLPPGLRSSDGETPTVSRERRRFAVAAREVTAALSDMIMSRFDALEAKTYAMETQLHSGLSSQECPICLDGLAARVCRVEALITISPSYAPSVDEVL